MPFTGLRAVLFDLDGTLVQSCIDFARMRREVLELVVAAGVDPAPLFDLDVLAAIQKAAERVPDPGAFRAAAEERLVRIELEACSEVREMPGACDTLRWLAAEGFAIGIVTRNSPQAARLALQRVPLPHSILLTRADTPRTKPDPIHLLLALEHLNVPPDAAVMVGDHLMDMQGGRAAGTRTLGLLTPGYPQDYFSPVSPDGVLQTLPELKAWISRSSS